MDSVVKQAVAFGFLAAVAGAGLAVAPARADTPEFTIVIESHRFTPSELKVPAGTKIRLLIENRDPTPEEFESYDFDRERIVSGKSRIVIFVGPLKRGRYEFFGDFNAATARGHLVAE